MLTLVPFAGSLRVELHRFDGFYGGRLSELSLTETQRPSPLFIIELNARHNVGRVPQRRFVQNVVGTRLRVNVTPDLQVGSSLQNNNGSRRIGSNTRLRRSFAPQGECFLVYSHNLGEERDLLNRRTGWQFASNQPLIELQ